MKALLWGMLIAIGLSAGALLAQDNDRQRGEPEPGGAGPPGGGRLGALFDRTDANSDGKITQDEMPENLRDRFGQMLERIGAESAGKEQFARFMAQARERNGDGRGDRRPGAGRPPLIAALDADGDGELSAAEIEGAGKALAKLDKNSDGKLSREEMSPPLGVRRPGDAPPGAGRGRFNPEQFQSRLKEADKSSDGKLSKEEVEKAELPPMFKENFDRIDANSDGQLDQDELRQMFRRIRAGRPDGERRPDAPPRD